jgi:two-component system, NarL family, nitrate/nitrite response regulator NarL
MSPARGDPDRPSAEPSRSGDPPPSAEPPPSADAVRVAVADDHPMFRAGVVASLREVPGIDLVGEASDAPAAVELARALLPDVMLLDIAMPGGGLVAASGIKAACPVTRIVMLTVSEDEDDLMAAMKAGASGYVLKGAGASELVEVIRAVHAGEVYVAPGLAWRMLREMSEPRAGPFDDLTQREREVLELVAEGLSNSEIGERLGLAEKTIKHYMTNILGKLQVRSRVEAALLVARQGSPPTGH